MKNKKLIMCIGLVSVVLVFVILLTVNIIYPECLSNLGNFKWILFGVIAGAVGAICSIILNKLRFEKNSEKAKLVNINENDERNIIIRKTAGYYMWFVTLYLLCAMSFIFVMLDLTIAMWITIAVMIIHVVLYFILLVQINKKI